MTQKLTHNRYTAATVFVDHFSKIYYLMPSNIEQFAANHCLHINQYHADNGHFANNAFRKHSSQQWQIVSFCNVNAHFQNEIAYREFKGVTKSAKIMLIHAKT
ncbi:hypothetical protein ACHAW6_003097 [Cyclotella cf. meneghiniana]